MTIYVTEPTASGKGLKKPVMLTSKYQPDGVSFDHLQELIDDHLEANYFSDDADADFGLPVIDLSEYVVEPYHVGAVVLIHLPTDRVSIISTDTSLETLLQRAQRHHAGGAL